MSNQRLGVASGGITSRQILSFDLNPMTKEVLMVTERELVTFDIEKNQFKAVKNLKSLLTYAVQSNPTL